MSHGLIRKCCIVHLPNADLSIPYPSTFQKCFPSKTSTVSIWKMWRSGPKRSECTSISPPHFSGKSVPARATSLQPLNDTRSRRNPCSRAAEILCNTLQYSAILCKTLQYSVILWMTLGAEETLAAAAPPLRVHSPLKMPSNLSSSLLGMCRSLSGRNRPKLCVPCDKKVHTFEKKSANMSYVTAPISVRRRKFSIFTIFNGSSDSYENVLIGSVNNTFGGLDFNVGAPSVLLMCPRYLHF